MPFKNDDIFFLIICSVEIFKAIILGNRNKNTITYRDFLNHVTDVKILTLELFQLVRTTKGPKTSGACSAHEKINK